MQASGPLRFRHLLPIGAATLALAACGGGGNSSFNGGASGSSSGGNSSVLAGTFTTQTGSSQRTINGATDTVFGAIDGQGNGFLADMSAAGAGNQAVLRLSPASQPNAGTVSGSYDAYSTGGSNNSVILGGSLTGTYTASGASLSFGPASGGTSNGGTAMLVLDKPVLAQASSLAGTYTAQVGTVGSNGSLAISTSTNQMDIYTVTVGSSGSIAINDSSGCNFNSTSVTPVSSLDIYDLQANGTCPSTTGGTVSTITLTGLAVYLPAGSKSPLGSGTLAQPALLLELDDSEINNGSNHAFALLAVQ